MARDGQDFQVYKPCGTVGQGLQDELDAINANQSMFVPCSLVLAQF